MSACDPIVYGKPVESSELGGTAPFCARAMNGGCYCDGSCRKQVSPAIARVIERTKAEPDYRSKETM